MARFGDNTDLSSSESLVGWSGEAKGIVTLLKIGRGFVGIRS